MKKKPICLMSGFSLGLIDNYETHPIIKTFQEREKIIQDNGLELKLLIPHQRFWGNIGYPLGRELPQAMPETVIQLDDKEAEDDEEPISYMKALNWPRDIFQKFKGRTLVSPSNLTYFTQILNALGRPIKEKRMSYYGIGGLSIKARDLRIVAKSVRLNSCLEDLEWVGEKPYIMPCPCSPEGRRIVSKNLRDRMSNRHMDTEIGFAENSSGNAVLLASPEYHEAYKQEVTQLAKKLDAKPYVCTGERMAMNLINLPNGRVALPKEYGHTAEFLKEVLGKENVIQLETLPGEITSSGGLRCRTNIVH